METESHEPFLRLVARAFVKHYAASLHDICFIFPNRRSGVFFMKELAECTGNHATLAPEIMTISDFLCDITGCIEPSKIELLLILYNKYREVAGKKADDFDRFSYWGDIILNDFNDVDKYLADAQNIFKNIRELKSIKANFLTNEQKEVIARYFGDYSSLKPDDDDSFWLGNDLSSNSAEKFRSIWDMLYPIYTAFNNEMERLQLSYPGKTYRNAVARIKDMAPEDFKHCRYVFVGFNVLSISEIKIFESLKNKGIADYYWDCNSPALRDNSNKASWFISQNIKMFPSRIDIDEPEIDNICPLTVRGIPSNIGQAKFTATIIDKLIDSGDIPDTANAINTAIVLPDEGLFLPMLNSINSRISNVNITMGYPLRLSGIALFINQIAKMHKQARKGKQGFQYFHEDVKDLLSHPFTHAIAGKNIENIYKLLAQSNRFYVSAADICEASPELADLFKPVGNTKSAAQLIEYVHNIVQFVEAKLINCDNISHNSVEAGFIARFIDTFSHLAYAVGKYTVEMNENTFFYLVGRMVSSATVAFEGEPLKGLQIMGVLETRCMDFENLIVLSMNERTFPRKHYSRSFIPGSLRHAFGMATVEFQDCMYAYYFYRMISRAKNVYLLYDARTQSLGSGEPSRYIEQIKTLYSKVKVDHDVINFSIKVPEERPISVVKDSRIMDSLSKYATPGSGFFLSASAINKYINCPLMFYFEKVEHLKIDDEVTEFMDASTLGSIVHSVMEQLYKTIATPDTHEVTKEAIYKLLQNDKLISNTVMITINDVYSGIKNCTEVLTGETLIVRDAIIFYVASILHYDADLGGFTLLQAEKKEEISWQITPDLSINMRQYIDRVDIITDKNNNKITRIVDYKTGKDSASASSIDMLFKPESAHRNKAMLQLMIYCNIYALNNPKIDNLKPAIYTVRKMHESGFKIKGTELTSYLDNDYNDDFLRQLSVVIHEMFNPDVPFTPTKRRDICDYCKFAAFCHR